MIGPESSEHQMTIDECIEVAERNLDGKSGDRLADELLTPRAAKRLKLAADPLSPAEAARHYLNRKDRK
jgi:hypothetical protein